MFSQFVTLQEAMQIAKDLGTIGGGVRPYKPDSSEESGIYVPEYGYFQTPQDGERRFYHFRFANGAEGFNAGLVKGTMEMFPTRWPIMIATEVRSAGRW